MSRLTKLRALKWPTVAYEVQKNLRSRARGRRGGLRSITAHGASLGTPTERVAYSRMIFDLYRQNGSPERVDRAWGRVLELGPGEDFCVALRFLAAGAEHVSCVDRFEFHVDPQWEREVYRELLGDLDDAGRDRLARLVGPDGSLEAADARLEAIRGVGIEEAPARLRGARFDLIASVAVLEHVYDLEASFRAMDELLAPGGVMVHQVDLRDHGMFSGGGRPALDFLTIRDPVYRLMTSHTGAPNRERAGRYRELLSALGHEARVQVTNVGGAREDLNPYRERIDVDAPLAASIERLRPRMAPRFSPLTAEELATTGILIRSVKPRAPA
jgi:SAM-dependent methyltransferase